MSQRRSVSLTAFVLKQSKTGEADRIVTLLTAELGKVVAIAKGTRRLNSSQAGQLQPGNVVKCQLALTHGLAIVTQTTLLADCLPIHGQLAKFRQLTQLLEIIERLFVEEELDAEVFDQVLAIRALIIQSEPTPGVIKERLAELVEQLGYQPFSDTQYSSILEYVGVLSDQPLVSWEYMQVK